MLCEVKVILSCMFLKSNLHLVTLHCAGCQPRHTDAVMEFWASVCSFYPSQLGNPMVWLRTGEPCEGACGLVAPRSAVPGPPPCSETPLKWKKVSKCKFPENFFSMEQHLQTVYLPFIFALYLSLSSIICTYRERYK